MSESTDIAALFDRLWPGQAPTPLTDRPGRQSGRSAYGLTESLDCSPASATFSVHWNPSQ